MKINLGGVKALISDRFNLNDDKADEQQIVDSIEREVNFKGTNLWTLIFAIFIASIGLNVNSTAVIIGAMLISPLMGPILGVGLGIGINDFELLKRGIKNLGIAAIISIITSSLYFSVTPLQQASSELLARTNPSVWDVFIAFFGGLAGIVAGTRKEKSNVLPGVAIATALMPPLCTAGFGLATGQWFYFFGALYLFFINSFFICLAVFLVVKHLKFHKKEFASAEKEKRVSRYIFIIAFLTILPSIYLAYRIVQRTIFEQKAKQFVLNEFHFAKTQVVTHNYRLDGKKSSIELLLVGQPLSPGKIDSLRKLMPAYKLDSTQLLIHQGLDARQKINLSEIKASVLEEVFATEKKKDTLPPVLNKLEKPIPDIKKELKSLYPAMQTYSIRPAIFTSMTSARKDTMILFVAKFSGHLSSKEKARLSSWLKQRLLADSINVVVE